MKETQSGLRDYQKKTLALLRNSARLLESLKEIVEITDRDHEAWTRAKALIAEIEGNDRS